MYTKWVPTYVHNHKRSVVNGTSVGPSVRTSYPPRPGQAFPANVYMHMYTYFATFARARASSQSHVTSVEQYYMQKLSYNFYDHSSPIMMILSLANHSLCDSVHTPNVYMYICTILYCTSTTRGSRANVCLCLFAGRTKINLKTDASTLRTAVRVLMLRARAWYFYKNCPTSWWAFYDIILLPQHRWYAYAWFLWSHAQHIASETLCATHTQNRCVITKKTSSSLLIDKSVNSGRSK